MGIAWKEINENIYWPELLKETDYINKVQFVTFTKMQLNILNCLLKLSHP